MAFNPRQPITHIDGTMVFQTKEDQQRQAAVARRMEQVWDCKLHAWGALTVIDWYATKNGRLAGFAELKSAPYRSDRYPEIRLAFRKWMALASITERTNIPSVFAKRFTDCIKWIPFRLIDPRITIIGGADRPVDLPNNYEPMIVIPMKSFFTADLECHAPFPPVADAWLANPLAGNAD